MSVMIVCVLVVDNTKTMFEKPKEPRVGIRFTYGDKVGVILQSGKDLPPYLQTGEEGDGPFFGVSYLNEYIWYNKKDMMEVLIKSRIQ